MSSQIEDDNEIDTNNEIDNEVYKEDLTLDEIKEYSKMLIKKFDDINTDIITITSCNKIDDLPVTVFIKRRYDTHKKRTIKYHIIINLNFETNGLYVYHEEGPRVFNQSTSCSKNSENKNIEHCIKLLINLSGNLKFDNYQSKFIEDSEKRFFELERKAFKNNLDDKECCVCFEKTTSTTTCDHPICVKCFYQIRKKSIDDTVKCPMCRKKFGIDYEDYDEDDDEYSDELNIMEDNFNYELEEGEIINN